MILREIFTLVFLPQTEEKNALFVELGVEESLRDETYLPSFLAYSLCICKLDGSWREIFFGGSNLCKHLTWPQGYIHLIKHKCLRKSMSILRSTTMSPYPNKVCECGRYLDKRWKKVLALLTLPSY
ncbi:hypothetical protein H5410_002958 [Solanum commersonii]|uniref:Uncharacterized protein n=1 Tax=Solanum commersonii TaxID=4109 RepID=A0A9J6B3F9_SOLCO|nr:hypothetical protein H5410_002958 [Solanum commersonii]